MPRTLSIAEAQAQPAQVLADACNGEDIIITRNNMPILHLQPIAPPEAEVSTVLCEQREKAIESIKARRKNRQEPAATIEEIIAWRNEGRK